MAVQQKDTFKENNYCIKVPNNIVEVYVFNRENGNFLWCDTIRKEMKGLSPAFGVLDEGVKHLQ